MSVNDYCVDVNKFHMSINGVTELNKFLSLILSYYFTNFTLFTLLFFRDNRSKKWNVFRTVPIVEDNNARDAFFDLMMKVLNDLLTAWRSNLYLHINVKIGKYSPISAVW